MITCRPRRDWCHGERTPGSWQMHGNNLIAKHWLWNPLEKIRFVQTQPQLLSQLCWWATCPTDWAVNLPYTIVSVTREILAYVRCRIFWVNWSIFHQHKTECGWFYSKKNLGNTKSSKRKSKVCHMEKMTDSRNLCILVLNTNLILWMTHLNGKDNLEIYSYHYMGRCEKR